MNETSDAGGKAKKAKAKPAKSSRPGGQAWTRTADGSGLSRTISFGSAEEAGKAARKALVGFQKAAQPIDLRLDGSSVTIRVAGAPSDLDPQVKRLVNRIAPKDPARHAARKTQAGAGEG